MANEDLLAQASEAADFGDELELVTLPVPVGGKQLRVVVKALTREERIAAQGGIAGLDVPGEDAKLDLLEAVALMRRVAEAAVVRPEFGAQWWDRLHDANQSAIFESAMRLGAKQPTEAVSALAGFPGAAGVGAGDGQ